MTEKRETGLADPVPSRQQGISLLEITTASVTNVLDKCCFLQNSSDFGNIRALITERRELD